jgi:hypothetical protein
MHLRNFRWVGDDRLAFDYRTECLEDYQVTLTVHADKVRAEGGGGQKLDGGLLAAGEDVPAREGVAMNGDDFQWRFRD